MTLRKTQDLDTNYSSLEYTELEGELVLLDSSNSEDFVLELPDPIEVLSKEIELQARASHIPKPNPNNNNCSGTLVQINFNDKTCTTRRVSGDIETRMESALAGLIEQRIQTKALPLALRKRLMYQQAIGT